MTNSEQLTLVPNNETSLENAKELLNFRQGEKEKEELSAYLEKLCKEIVSEQGFDTSAQIFSVEKSELKDGKLENHVHAVSVNIEEFNVFRLIIQKTKNKIMYKDYIRDHISGDYIDKSKPDKSRDFFFWFSLPKTEKNVIKLILSAALQYYTPTETFGCCSRYMQCSDVRQCTHPDKFYAKRCQYKRNLDQVRIFYGNNRNID